MTAEEAFERAATRCRYYLKNQNFPSWDEMSEYEKGVSVACENLARIMQEEKEKLQPLPNPSPPGLSFGGHDPSPDNKERWDMDPSELKDRY